VGEIFFFLKNFTALLNATNFLLKIKNKNKPFFFQVNHLFDNKKVKKNHFQFQK